MDTQTPESEPASIPVWAKPTDVPTAARATTELLIAAGVPEPAKVASRIGQGIFDCCDSTVPQCVADVLQAIRDVIAARPQTQEAKP